MTTIVNTPPTNNTSESSNGMNGFLMVGVFAVFLLLIFYFLLPVLRRATTVPQVNIPDKVDINVRTNQ